MDAHAKPRLVPESPVLDSLVLEIGERSVSVSLAAPTDEDAVLADTYTPAVYCLGRDDANDFVSQGPLTSRQHARIERQHKDYYLIDCSTNGTYIQTEDEQVTHVHRDKLKLWGEGWISLGEPLHMGHPIHFRQIQ